MRKSAMNERRAHESGWGHSREAGVFPRRASINIDREIILIRFNHLACCVSSGYTGLLPVRVFAATVIKIDEDHQQPQRLNDLDQLLVFTQQR
jgi:hypothetical protein